MMFCVSSALIVRRRLVQVLVLSITLNLLLPPLSYGRTLSKRSRIKIDDPTVAQPSVQTFVRVLNLPTNDIVFNQQTQKIHSTVPSSAGANGNSITDVDPVLGTVGQSVFIGSEPNKVALSADGQVLYAGLDGSAAVRRLDQSLLAVRFSLTRLRSRQVIPIL